MRKTVVIGGLVLAVIAASAIYFFDDAQKAVDSVATTSGTTTSVEMAKPRTADQANSLAKREASVPVPADPRLSALAVSQDNGSIEFVIGSNGKVISEIDKNPASRSFKKPLREYMYAGDRVIGLTAYQYLDSTVQVTKTRVSYKPDGSVDQFLESTDYIHPEHKAVDKASQR